MLLRVKKSKKRQKTGVIVLAVKFIKDLESFNEICSQYGVTLPVCNDAQILKQPVTVDGKKIPNRIVYQAMEGCDGTADGDLGELTRRRYLRFARGGAGLIWFEATAVKKEGRANPRQMFISEENKESYKKFVEEVKSTCLKENGYEPIIVMQLTHSGRYSKPNGYPEPIIAYNSPVYEKEPIDKSRIITDGELDALQDLYVKSALLAKEAGFDGVDIKSCHRYLLSELLSAYTREGKYGGSYENRTRMLKETIKKVKAAVGENFIVTVRLNAYDGAEYPYGFGVKENEDLTPCFDEAKRLVRELYELGVKMVDITMGNPYVNPHVNRPAVSGVPYEPDEAPIVGVERMLKGTRDIKAAVPEMKIVCSGITYLGAESRYVTAECIKENWFDFAGYGRMTLANPDIAKDIMTDKESKHLCVTCSKCTHIMRAGSTPGCAVFDREVYPPKDYTEKK